MLISTVNTEILLQSLIHAFGLSVGFGMISCSEVKLDIQDLTESRHEAGDEDQTAIGGDMLRKTVLRENVDEEELSEDLGGDILGCRNANSVL